MKGLLLAGGRVVDPASSLDDVADVLVRSGRIVRVEPGIEEPDVRVVDCSDRVVCPGFVDMHVHLREPGQEYAETVDSGTRAAVAGGFTAVACMANTVPVNDSASVTRAIVEAARAAGHARVHPIAAVTRGMKGVELTEFGDLKEAGVVALSDDGLPIADHAVMRRALEHAGMLDLPVIDHAEEPTLACGGQVNEGWMSTKLGLPGLPGVAEDLHVGRDVLLSALTGLAVHVAHVSTAMSLELVKRGKRAGTRITCEVTPHHFVLDEEALEQFDTNYKMKPPLRTKNDVKAVLKALRDGTVDCIASDHAPHHEDKKNVPLDEAAFGIVGLETAVPLALDRLFHAGVVDLPRLVSLMSWNPARILGVSGGTLAVGAPADITILDLERSVMVEPGTFESKSRNTPFGGWTLRGGPTATIVSGRFAWTLEDGVLEASASA